MNVAAVVAYALVTLVAVEHLYFLYLEMFAWTATRTRRAFGTSEEFAQASKALAANQGLYNGFLAVGLLHALWGPFANLHLAVLFLSFVLVAAIFGGITVNRRILLVQGLPALVAAIAVFVAL